MSLKVRAVGLVAAEHFGEVKEFAPRSELPNRKHLKLMSRADRLGVAAVGRAIARFPEWDQFAPERRGLFVGTTPEGTDPESLKPAIERSRSEGVFSVANFGEDGVPYVPPLWLVRGLSNNVLGFACAYWDIQGVNGNRCEGRVSGTAAIVEGARALLENRADVVVAGGADSLLRFAQHTDSPMGEGAAFILMTRDPAAQACSMGLSYEPGAPTLGICPGGVDVGAASGVLEWVRKLDSHDPAGRLEVRDQNGLHAWISLD